MTDHHLGDNADDQRRPSADELHTRGRHPSTSALAGAQAGRDLDQGTPLIDVVGHQHGDSEQRINLVRYTGEDIPAGAFFEVRADGRVYAVDEPAANLAEQLVDVAATPQAWVATTPTIFGVEVQLDDTIPKDELHLRDPNTGKTEVRIVNVHAPTPEERQRSVAGVLGRDLEPWASTETVTQPDPEEQP